MYEYSDQYENIFLRLNVLNPKFFWPLYDWFILDPTTNYFKDFLPSALFLVKTTTENQIEMYPSLPWIWEFLLRLPDLQGKYMSSNYSTAHDTSNASRDIPTSI